MISTVAVGTDGSETASEAVQQAAEFARRFDAKLGLLSAFKTDPPPPDAEAEEEMKELGIECTTLVDEGDPADVLVRLADECGADVLVIGNKGMQRRVLGSVPKSVAHNADCSVFVVKTT